MPIASRPLTISAWVKSETKNGVVVARGGASCGFSLYVKDGVPKFGIHRVQEGPTYIAAGDEQVVGSWVHLAGVVKEDRVEWIDKDTGVSVGHIQSLLHVEFIDTGHPQKVGMFEHRLRQFIIILPKGGDSE